MTNEIIKLATERQNRAAEVASSVWVSASAGTGKTYVLTNRILRLLLEDITLIPNQILAMTYTKAAAREMEERVRERLLEWQAMDSQELQKSLQQLLGKKATEKQIYHSKGLLAIVLDNPVNSSTIHGFCQSFLSKFPLEAGVSPNFNAMDEDESRELLQQSCEEIFQRAMGTKVAEKSSEEIKNRELFKFFTSYINEYNSGQVLGEFVANYRRFKHLFARYAVEKGDGLDGLLNELQNRLKITDVVAEFAGGELSPSNYEKVSKALCSLSGEREASLMQLAKILMNGKDGSIARKNADSLAEFLAGNGKERMMMLARYRSIFYTLKGKLSLRALTKPLREKYPQAEELFIAEAEFCGEIQDKIYSLQSYLLSSAYLKIGQEVLEVYERLKALQGRLDFDDLINKASDLLQDSEAAHWVRYKMDSQICHVLLDEAQDTNQEQWDILHRLIEEFYGADAMNSEQPRTFFAVGDMKQSIYRFRGAQPAVFGSMKAFLELKQSENGHKVNFEELMVSFRSTGAVLDFVDSVFESHTKVVDGMAEEIKHSAAKSELGGYVEIWKPMLTDFDEDGNKISESKPKVLKESVEWQLPKREIKVSGRVKMAEKVASSIQQLLNSSLRLETTGEYVQAGDILILLRNRSMMGEVIGALDNHGIPNSGADEIFLTNDELISDCMALLQFISNPQDSLSLAQVLKSPFFAMSDEELLAVSQSNGSGSLWGKLCGYAGSSFDREQLDILKSLLNSDGFMRPYEILQRAMDLTGVAASASQRMYGGNSLRLVTEVMHALLDKCLSWSNKNPQGSLSEFVAEFSSSSQRFKREMSESGNRVRVLTAHGAKGLEAPIVYMPDTTGDFYKQMAKDKSIWEVDNEDRDSLFLYRSGVKATASKLQKDLDEAERKRIFQDEMRILYVALTRAKERIYIGGVGKSKDLEVAGFNGVNNSNDGEEKNWHQLIMGSLLEGSVEFTETKSSYVFEVVGEQINASVAEGSEVEARNGDGLQVASGEMVVSSEIEGDSDNSWLYQVPKAEKGVKISKGSEAISENKGLELANLQVERQKFARGKILHRLLEVLPSLEIGAREARARGYLENYALDFSEKEREAMVVSSLRVLEKYPQFFGDNSRGEVAIVAEVGGSGSQERIEGVIDRLVVDEEQKIVTIVDFKTNKQVPKETPREYLQQMKVYTRAISKIFPNYQIKNMILWTESV